METLFTCEIRDSKLHEPCSDDLGSGFEWYARKATRFTPGSGLLIVTRIGAYQHAFIGTDVLALLRVDTLVLRSGWRCGSARYYDLADPDIREAIERSLAHPRRSSRERDVQKRGQTLYAWLCYWLNHKEA